ncbi:MAG: EF-hand domain-containing protein [Paracoccaceae bacterium]
MNNAFILIGLGTAVLFGSAALADDARKGGQRGAKLFERVDTNSDGLITRAEAAEFRTARFQRMDANGDGAVTFAELEEKAKRRIPERAAKRFERMDGNSDGKVTRAEFFERSEGRFARMDANGDGAITRDEVKARKDRPRGG